MASGLTKPHTTGSSSATRVRASERPWICEIRSLRSAAAGNARERLPSERRKKPTSGRLRASDSTTDATAFASANADYDNGAALPPTLGPRRRDERVAHPLDTKQGNRVEHALDVQHPTWPIFMHAAHMWRTGPWSSGISKSRFSSTCSGLCEMLHTDF